jgi:hypothetical protein
MLYRGSPSTVYRLSMGALPCKTFLFPPGGKRGSTLEAHVQGENMQPTTLSIPVDARAAEGVRLVSTRHGTFRFVAGDEPEYIEKPGSDPQSITLPISINGRIDGEGADQYRFSLTQEQLGAYSFEMYGERIGSPVVGRLILRDSRGRALVSQDGGRGSRDPRIDYTFTQAGEYTLAVQDDAGKSSPAHVYRISATAASPDFQLTLTPDNPNLGPGSSLYVQVQIRRRVGIPGEIEVHFPNLPPGVTAGPASIPANENQGFVVLTAAADAKPGTYQLIRAVGRAQVNGKTLEREALPYEIYRINNQAQISYRGNMVVTIGPEAEWTVSLEPGAMKMPADGAPVEVKVRLNRRGEGRDLPFAIVGIPREIQAPRSILFRRGQSEVSFQMRAGGGGNNRGPLPGKFAIAVVNGREGEGMMMCSPAVPVVLEERAP